MAFNSGVATGRNRSSMCSRDGLGQLRVVGLATPAVLILRAIIDQEQEPGGRQALDYSGR